MRERKDIKKFIVFFCSWEPSGVCTHGCISLCVDRKIHSLLLRKKFYRKESSTSLGSLEMDIVKMSPLNSLLAEEEKKGTRKKKVDPSTFYRPFGRIRFFFSFSLILHTWKQRESKNIITESVAR